MYIVAYDSIKINIKANIFCKNVQNNVCNH